MRIKVENDEEIFDGIKEALAGELALNLNSDESMLSIETCGETAEINKEELYMFIEYLSAIADGMLEGDE